MITLKVKKEKGLIVSFIVDGHAMGAGKGNNMLCAAVSALSQSIIIGMARVIEIDTIVDKKDGYLSCDFSKHVNDKVVADKITLLTLTFIRSMEDLQMQFPRDISISY